MGSDVAFTRHPRWRPTRPTAASEHWAPVWRSSTRDSGRSPSFTPAGWTSLRDSNGSQSLAATQRLEASAQLPHSTAAASIVSRRLRPLVCSRQTLTYPCVPPPVFAIGRASPELRPIGARAYGEHPPRGRGRGSRRSSVCARDFFASMCSCSWSGHGDSPSRGSVKAAPRRPQLRGSICPPPREVRASVSALHGRCAHRASPRPSRAGD
jgi:hypothetical protein